MSMYSAMARHYDALTADVPYEGFVNFFEKIFEKHHYKPNLVLDLACGTGTITKLMAERGYDMIGADYSVEMLMQAQAKCAEMWNPPTFIRQSMTGLDLYGTVDAVVSCLDSINYLDKPAALAEAFRRVSLFLNPGGLFIFDLNSEYKLEHLGGNSFVRETDDVFCVWQAAWDPKSRVAEYYIDLFEEDEEGAYYRSMEEHRERAYSVEEIRKALEDVGMELVKTYGELKLRAPAEDEQRIFFVARKIG